MSEEIKKMKIKKKLQFKLLDIDFGDLYEKEYSEEEISTHDTVDIKALSDEHDNNCVDTLDTIDASQGISDDTQEDDTSADKITAIKVVEVYKDEEFNLESSIETKNYKEAREYLNRNSNLIDFFDRRVDLYENLDKDALKELAKCGCVGPIKKISDIYMEENLEELSLLYKMNLINSRYEDDYKSKILDILDDKYLEKNSAYQTQLGLELYFGRFIEKNEEKALEILELADQNGGVLASNYIELINAKNENKLETEIDKEIKEKDEIISYLEHICKYR